MKFLAVPVLLAAAFAFACGGGDDDGDGPSAGNGGSTPTQAASGGNGGTGGGDTGIAGDTAVVTIAGERYEFTLLQCLQFGGALGGVGRAADGSDITVRIDLPPPGWEDNRDDWEPPSVTVKDDVKEMDWAAGGEVIEGFATVSNEQSNVDSYVIDGKRGSGTANFVDLNQVLRGNVEPVQGTFEIACK